MNVKVIASEEEMESLTPNTEIVLATVETPKEVKLPAQDDFGRARPSGNTAVNRRMVKVTFRKDGQPIRFDYPNGVDRKTFRLALKVCRKVESAQKAGYVPTLTEKERLALAACGQEK